MIFNDFAEKRTLFSFETQILKSWVFPQKRTLFWAYHFRTGVIYDNKNDITPQKWCDVDFTLNEMTPVNSAAFAEGAAFPTSLEKHNPLCYSHRVVMGWVIRTDPPDL